MSNIKPAKLDFTTPTNSGSKRPKSDPLSPHKLTSPRDSEDSLKEVLGEIRAVKGLVVANGDAIAKVQAEVSEMRAQIRGLSERIDKVDAEVNAHSAQLTCLNKTVKRVESLEQQLEDLNNRGRRNNVRLIGLPEGAEGADLSLFLSKLIPAALQLTFPVPFEFERAHRVPSQRSLHAKGPRPVIFCLLKHQQAVQILAAAKAQDSVSYEGRSISFFPDLCKTSVDKRRRFLAMRPRLQQLQARYGLLYPARLRVTFHNVTKTYDDPREVLQFLEEQEGLKMQ